MRRACSVSITLPLGKEVFALWDCLFKDVTEVIEFKNILNKGKHFLGGNILFFLYKKLKSLECFGQ